MYAEEVKELQDRIVADVEEMSQKCPDLILVDAPDEDDDDEEWQNMVGFWNTPLVLLFDEDDGRYHDASLVRIYRHNNRCRVQMVSRETFTNRVYSISELELNEIAIVADALIKHLLNLDVVDNMPVAVANEIEF